MKAESLQSYADIIDLPHYVSRRHPPMSMEKRAAQFSPFAAMVGHDAVLRETERLTEERPELSEDEQAVVNRRLRFIQAHIKERSAITVTYFRPDEKKSGGAYVTVTGTAEKFDWANRVLILAEGVRVPINDIVALAPD